MFALWHGSSSAVANRPFNSAHAADNRAGAATMPHAVSLVGLTTFGLLLAVAPAEPLETCVPSAPMCRSWLDGPSNLLLPIHRMLSFRFHPNHTRRRFFLLSLLHSAMHCQMAPLSHSAVPDGRHLHAYHWSPISVCQHHLPPYCSSHVNPLRCPILTRRTRLCACQSRCTGCKQRV
jgi:hypothetical protein